MHNAVSHRFDLKCRYEWGRYDVLLLPPSFPYGGMVIDSRRPVPYMLSCRNNVSTVLFTGESVPYVCHTDVACR